MDFFDWERVEPLLLMWVFVSIALLVLLVVRVWMVLPCFTFSNKGAGMANRKVRCLVVLGSGGHTAEMMYDLAP